MNHVVLFFVSSSVRFSVSRSQGIKWVIQGADNIFLNFQAPFLVRERPKHLRVYAFGNRDPNLESIYQSGYDLLAESHQLIFLKGTSANLGFQSCLDLIGYLLHLRCSQRSLGMSPWNHHLLCGLPYVL